MDRRDFIKVAGQALAGRSPGTPHPRRSRSGRIRFRGPIIFPINRNWRYSRSVVNGGHGRNFDDSSLERRGRAHTNVRLPWHSFDDKRYEFVSLYRRHFKLPPAARGHACSWTSKAS